MAIRQTMTTMLHGMLLAAWLLAAIPAAQANDDTLSGLLGTLTSDTDELDTPASGLSQTQEMILHAMSLLGVSYKWGGNSPETGLDCSGFVKHVFAQSLGIQLPRTAREMARVGKVIDRADMKPGDLVFFNTRGAPYSHVGIYLGDHRFIHSPRKGRNIEVVSMRDGYWAKRFNGARQYSKK
jgi:cell wall-associated NlpC family hydrolase